MEGRARRIRQPWVAEIVASTLRDDILSGRLRAGDILPTQANVFQEFGVGPPALPTRATVSGGDAARARSRRPTL